MAKDEASPRRDPREVAERSSPPQQGAFDASHYSKAGTCSTCCSFFCFFFIIPIAFCFYHVYPTSVLMLSFIWALITLTPWLLHAGGAVLSDFSGPCLTMTMVFSMVFTFLISVRTYYVHYEPMRHLMLAREYSGVYPQLPAVAFPDAALVKFDGNVTLDKNRAVSYKTLDSGAVTFCVAPITTETNAGRVEFWAYGVDCCGDAGGEFTCDAADDENARNGVVLPDSKDDLWKYLGLYISTPDIRRDVYVAAVKRAEALYQVATPGEASVFVRWTAQNKKALLRDSMVLALGALLVIVVCLAFLSFCATRLHQRFRYVRQEHRNKQLRRGHLEDMDNTEEMDWRERMDEFVARTLEERENYQQKRRSYEWSLKDVCCYTVFLPFLVTMLCVLLLSYGNCWTYGYLIIVPFYCVLIVSILACLTFPHRTVTGIFMLLVAVNGSYVGLTNYRENMFHYCSVGLLRSYEDVLADSNSAEYADAGKLQFKDSARLRSDLSVGFLYEDEMYCAAPIISDTAPCSTNGTTSLIEENLLQYPQGQSLIQDKRKKHHIIGKRQTTGRVMPKHHGRQHNMMAPATVHEGSHLNFFQQSSQYNGRHRHRHRKAPAPAPAPAPVPPACSRPNPAKIDWWAIGKGCCNQQAKFWCDGGGNTDAHSAVVVRAFGDEAKAFFESIVGFKLEGTKENDEIFMDQRVHFYEAINKSVAKFSLPAPENPMMLRWGTNTDDLKNDWWTRAATVVVTMGIASFIVFAVIGLVSYCYHRASAQSQSKQPGQNGRNGSGAVQADQRGNRNPSPYYGNDPFHVGGNDSQKSLQPAQSADLKNVKGQNSV